MVASGIWLLQLADITGPFSQGKYRGAFKLHSLSIGRWQASLSPGSSRRSPSRNDFFVTLPVDSFTQRLWAASIKGTRVESAGITLVTETDQKALLEKMRFVYTNVNVLSVSMSAATGDSVDIRQTMAVSFYGDPPANL